ncbi:MAG: hypothetical protein J6T27_03115 [Alphaproteobacteria bacterium]|jgi:hypothetical protein|nr:hypothetical protein [Alphaproteobacteria bacterium]
MKKIKNWYRGIRDVIINPRRFFSKIVADGDIEESMLKAFIYGLLGGLAVLGIKLIGGATITINSVFTAVVIVPVIAVALLFIGGGLMMLVSEMTGGERDWEIAIKGLASIFFIYPVILILNAIAFNCLSMWIISIVGDVYVLFLFYNIALYCMRGRRVAVAVVVGIFAIFMLTVYLTNYHIGWFLLKNTGAALSCLI